MPLHQTDALLTIAAAEFDRFVEFYRCLLSQEPSKWIPNSYAEFQLPGLRLGIFRPKIQNSFQVSGSVSTIAAPSKRDPSQPMHLPIQGMSLCLEVVDLKVAIAHLTALGYPPPGDIITASHGREIYAFDPGGNWLILHESA